MAYYNTHTLTYSFVQMRDLYERRPRRRATRAINIGQFDIKFSPFNHSIVTKIFYNIKSSLYEGNQMNLS